MPVHGRKRPLVPACHTLDSNMVYTGDAKDLPVEDLLYTLREEIQKMETKKTSVIWNVRILHQEGQSGLLLDDLEKKSTSTSRAFQKHTDVVM